MTVPKRCRASARGRTIVNNEGGTPADGTRAAYCNVQDFGTPRWQLSNENYSDCRSARKRRDFFPLIIQPPAQFAERNHDVGPVGFVFAQRAIPALDLRPLRPADFPV